MLNKLGGTGSVLALVFSVLIAGFAIGWAVMIAFALHGAHTYTDDLLIGACLLVSVTLAVPADVEAAARVLRPIVPWKVRDTSETVIPSLDHTVDNLEGRH